MLTQVQLLALVQTANIYNKDTYATSSAISSEEDKRVRKEGKCSEHDQTMHYTLHSKGDICVYLLYIHMAICF